MPIVASIVYGQQSSLFNCILFHVSSPESRSPRAPPAATASASGTVAGHCCASGRARSDRGRTCCAPARLRSSTRPRRPGRGGSPTRAPWSSKRRLRPRPVCCSGPASRRQNSAHLQANTHVRLGKIYRKPPWAKNTRFKRLDFFVKRYTRDSFFFFPFAFLWLFMTFYRSL